MNLWALCGMGYTLGQFFQLKYVDLNFLLECGRHTVTVKFKERIFQVCGDVRLELFCGQAGRVGRTSSSKVHWKNPSLLGHVAPL